MCVCNCFWITGYNLITLFYLSPSSNHDGSSIVVYFCDCLYFWIVCHILACESDHCFSLGVRWSRSYVGHGIWTRSSLNIKQDMSWYVHILTVFSVHLSSIFSLSLSLSVCNKLKFLVKKKLLNLKLVISEVLENGNCMENSEACGKWFDNYKW